MPSILSAITSGSIASPDDATASSEPVLDLSDMEEQELPFLSVATVQGVQGEEDKISVLVMESRCQVGHGRGKLERMLGIGVDGCKQVRTILEGVVRSHGAKMLKGRKS